MKKIFLQKLKETENSDLIYSPEIKDFQKKYIKKLSHEKSFNKSRQDSPLSSIVNNVPVYVRKKILNTDTKKNSRSKSPFFPSSQKGEETQKNNFNFKSHIPIYNKVNLLEKIKAPDVEPILPRFPFEDFILIEEKIIQITTNLKNDSITIINNFIEWWNCYTASFFFVNSFPFEFNAEIKERLNSTSKILMYSIILCYYNILLEVQSKSFHTDKLLEMMLYHHRLYLLMCEIFIRQIRIKMHSWFKNINASEKELFKKIEKQVQFYINRNKDNCLYYNNLSCYKTNNKNNSSFVRNINNIEEDDDVSIKELKTYSKLLGEVIEKNLEDLKSKKSLPIKIEVFTLYDNLQYQENLEINYFFFNNFFHQKQTMENSIKYVKEVQKKNNITVPYLTKNSTKKFTLVLDLDETLIHFVQDKSEKVLKKGTVQFRPGLNEFLENVSPYYELVIFTVGTKIYADSLINAIEKGEKIFTHRLYREHATIYHNDFVKDLSKIGRDLSKVIIIDDKPSNFCLQKDNGIAIKPFWGQECLKNETKEKNELDDTDFALLNLIPILVDIAKDKTQDVRKGILKNKFSIITHVSTWLYKKNNEF